MATEQSKEEYEAAKHREVTKILVNPVYKRDSGLVRRLRSALMFGRLSLTDLRDLNVILDLRDHAHRDRVCPYCQTPVRDATVSERKRHLNGLCPIQGDGCEYCGRTALKPLPE